MKQIPFLFLLCALLYSCTNTASVATADETLHLTKAHNGQTLRVKMNDKFDATFNECVGCADVWRVTSIDEEKIARLPDAYTNKSCTDCVGGNQDHVFNFLAQKKGESTLSFAYFSEQLNVTIVVE